MYITNGQVLGKIHIRKEKARLVSILAQACGPDRVAPPLCLPYFLFTQQAPLLSCQAKGLIALITLSRRIPTKMFSIYSPLPLPIFSFPFNPYSAFSLTLHAPRSNFHPPTSTLHALFGLLSEHPRRSLQQFNPVTLILSLQLANHLEYHPTCVDLLLFCHSLPSWLLPYLNLHVLRSSLTTGMPNLPQRVPSSNLLQR
jgi:hypothetical protein